VVIALPRFRGNAMCQHGACHAVAVLTAKAFCDI
jgi:hypothetical protein